MMYLHGILRPPHPERDGDRDTPELPRAKLLPYRDVAAIVSLADADELDPDDIEVARRLRQEMRTHVEILNGSVRAEALVPVRFGTIFPDEATLVDELLEPCYDAIWQALDRVSGAVEVKIHAECDREFVLQEVTSREPVLAAASGGAARGRRSATAPMDSRIELGRQVVAAIESRRDELTAELLERLHPCAREVSLREATSELSVLNASFLVDRGQMEAFDREVDHWASEYEGRVRMTCVGPLPPYSFVDLWIGEAT